MRIVRATPDDAGRLTDIALAAKRHWGYAEALIAAWTPALTVTEQFLASHPTYLAEVDGETVGFYSLVFDLEDGIAQLEHLWVEPPWIGRGLGRALFEHATNTAAAAGLRTLRLEADPNAEAFYLHMGAERVDARSAAIDERPRVLPILNLALSAPRG